ncbi:MAG: bglG1 [Bacillota bacterium]|nr:bglG1 [Bacillota bacterium]
MIIQKIFNNNAVVITDHDGIEKIVMGCGLGYKKRCGEVVDQEKIDKVFILSDPDANTKFQQLMTYIPGEFIELGEDIITYVTNALDQKLNDTIYISLIDHLYGAIKNASEGIFVRNAILWEIKRYYKKEFNIGLKVLDMVEKRFSIRLPDDEAGFIAIHIVESSQSQHVEDMHKISEIITDISNIIQYNFHISFQEDSVNHYRFITHLKFFAQRILEGKTYLDDHQDDLLNTVKLKYVNSYECAEKISAFLKSKFNYDISNDEKLYLTIHIERIVYKSVL